MRSLVAFVLVSYLKFAAVCIASPVAWFGATIWLMIAYFVIINRIIKKQISLKLIIDVYLILQTLSFLI